MVLKQNPTVLLEICAGSLLSALAAQAGGADRIELCENLNLGGTTPSFGTLSLARQLISLPIHVLIRPRTGNFVYHTFELSAMRMDIETCKILGMQGIVFGVLLPDGKVDTKSCAQLLEVSKPLPVTFHRAFDETPEPLLALRELIDLGFDRILTSGQKPTAVEGVELLKELHDVSSGKLTIMPGGGVRPDNISNILQQTKVREIHSSAVPYTNKRNDLTDPALVSEMKSKCFYT